MDSLCAWQRISHIKSENREIASWIFKCPTEVTGVLHVQSPASILPRWGLHHPGHPLVQTSQMHYP